MLRWFKFLVALVPVAGFGLGCTPEDREQILVGGDSGDGGTGEAGCTENCDDAGACTGEQYPCGPYGHDGCDTIADLSFIPASDPARDVAQDDFLDLHDLFLDDDVLGVLLFGTAGWCPACRTEAIALVDLYDDYQNIDGSGGRIEFVTVVFQDTQGNPATADYAAGYGDQYDFPFPTVADSAGDVLQYFDASSSPGNILIDATTMKIVDVVQGFDEARIQTSLDDLNGGAQCQL